MIRNKDGILYKAELLKYSIRKMSGFRIPRSQRQWLYRTLQGTQLIELSQVSHPYLSQHPSQRHASIGNVFVIANEEN